MLKKNNKFEFSENHIALAKKIKEQCKNLPFLTLPSDEDNLILETGVSEEVWSAVLKIKSNLLCRYASGMFLDTEKRYHINEKELLAVIRGCHKFYYFLLPKKFKLRTDNSQVRAFIKNNIKPLPQNKRLIRWQMALSEFMIEIELIKSDENCLADFLTRDGKPNE